MVSGQPRRPVSPDVNNVVVAPLDVKYAYRRAASGTAGSYSGLCLSGYLILVRLTAPPGHKEAPMRSEIVLSEVTREDVARIAEWLEDPAVSDMWFGRYTYGEPAHLGYEPLKMIDATPEEWDEVFHDPHHEPHRSIMSVRTASGEHIGEAQLAIDEALGDAQLSILIGRKELWHRGYGTATVISCLDHIFRNLGLFRAWVDVPEYNNAAREMFEHLGFVHEGTLRKSRPHEGARFDSVVMGILANEYASHEHPEGTHVV